MPIASTRLAPSPDALRLLRRLALGASWPDSSGYGRRRPQYTLVRKVEYPQKVVQDGSVQARVDVRSNADSTRWQPSNEPSSPASSATDAQVSEDALEWQNDVNVGTRQVRSGRRLFRSVFVDAPLGDQAVGLEPSRNHKTFEELETYVRKSNMNTPDEWVAELLAQDRLAGLEGVRATLRCMRAAEITPPEETVVANHFWSLLCKYGKLLDLTVDYVTDLYKRGERVPQSIWLKLMTASFRHGSLSDATKVFHRLQANDLIDQGQLVSLVKKMRLNATTLADLRNIYLSSRDRDIYDTLIVRLTDQGLYDQAVSWHMLLIEKGDLPSAALQTHPFVREMRYSGLLQVSSKNVHVAAGVEASIVDGLRVQDQIVKATTDSAKQPITARLTREIMSRILGDVHGVKPIDISDHICARFFATTAFPVDFVITGLAAFGVNGIGPLALRQLALRCSTSQEILDKIERIKNARLILHPCIFTSLVLRLAGEGRDALLKSMLASDQHPDVIANKDTQLQLLQKHVHDQDWQSAHWTLYILVHFHSHKEHEAWKGLITHHAESSDWTAFTKVLDDAVGTGLWLDPATVLHVVKLRLRARRQGRRPILLPHAPDELLYLSNFMRTQMQRGCVLAPSSWLELTRRFGMEGRWTDLSRLLLWLAQYYSTDAQMQQLQTVPGDAQSTLMGCRKARWQMRQALQRSLQNKNTLHSLRQLFSAAMQRAIVDWGFQSGFRHLEGFFRHQFKLDAKLNHFDSYSFRDAAQYRELSRRIAARLPGPTTYPLRGLALLRQLQVYGVHIDATIVRRALETRLWLLYGPDDESKVKANRRARQINPWTIEEMLVSVAGTTGSSRNPLEFPSLPEELDGTSDEILQSRTDIEPAGWRSTRLESTSREAESQTSEPVDEPLNDVTQTLDQTVITYHNNGNDDHDRSIPPGSVAASKEMSSETFIREPQPLTDLVPSTLNSTTSPRQYFETIFGATTAAVLNDINRAEIIRLQGPAWHQYKPHFWHRPLLDTTKQDVDLSQRAEIQRRVRLAVSFFGLGRRVTARRGLGQRSAERMTVEKYVELVKKWAHRRLKRKLGISGALARPLRGRAYEYGGGLRRSHHRRGVIVKAGSTSPSERPHSTEPRSEELHRATHSRVDLDSTTS